MRRSLLLTLWLLATASLATAAPPASGGDASGKGIDFNEGGSILEGKVLRSADGKAAGRVEILAYHLEREKIYRGTADASGRFRFRGLPHGYFDLAIRSGEDFYPVGEVVHIPPRSRRVATLTLVDREERSEDFWTERTPRDYLGPEAGVDGEAAGLADLESRMTGREFWRTGKGVAIISSIGGAGLLALAVSVDEDPLASQFVPNP